MQRAAKQCVRARHFVGLRRAVEKTRQEIVVTRHRRRDGIAQSLIVRLMRRIGGGEFRATARPRQRVECARRPQGQRVVHRIAVPPENPRAEARVTRQPVHQCLADARRERRPELAAAQRLATEGIGDRVCAGHFSFPQTKIVIPAKAGIHGRMRCGLASHSFQLIPTSSLPGLTRQSRRRGTRRLSSQGLFGCVSLASAKPRTVTLATCPPTCPPACPP